MDINLDYAGMVWLDEVERRIEAIPSLSIDELDALLAQVSVDLTTQLEREVFG